MRMKVIVGLGNPGSKYDATRHNVGFAVIDYLASGPGVGTVRKKFQSELFETTEGAEPVLLVKPQTFMNLSGRAVREILDFYKLAPTDLMVICDDLALPLGKLRVRSGGSHGGQNGLRNIQEQLGTQDYPRLRIGIDPPGEYLDAADYVLSRFKPGERDKAEDAVALAAKAALLWVREGIEVCMNRTNGGADGEKKKKPKKNEDAVPKDESGS